MSVLNEKGNEVFSGERKAYPLHIGKKQPSIHELVRQMILAQKYAEQEGYESFADADDFDVDDDPGDPVEHLPHYQDMRYEYEKDFDHAPDLARNESDGMRGASGSEEQPKHDIAGSASESGK